MTAQGEGPRGAAPEKIDLNDLLRQGQFDISIKPAENEPDARARRFKEQLTFILAAAMTAVVFLVCLCILLFGHSSAEEQRWVQSALTLILGASVGAAFNKK
jgi:lysylphosphatidylglycerol synthetase-like protein (DUF2156 family)